MDNNLSAEAKTLLIELRNNQYFREILNLIAIDKPVLFKSIREGTLHVEDQNANWHYESGRIRERYRIISLFSGEK